MVLDFLGGKIKTKGTYVKGCYCIGQQRNTRCNDVVSSGIAEKSPTVIFGVIPVILSYHHSI